MKTNIWRHSHGRFQVLAAEGNVLLNVQRNDDTSTITLNQRFVFGGVPNKVKGQVYEVYAFKTHMDDEACNERLLGLELRRLNNNEGQDDLYNNIADIYKKNWYTVEVNEEDMTQAVGFERQLNYSVFKDNDIATVDVIWESSNENIAQIDNNGVLKVLGIGQSVITCYMKDNKEVKDSFIVTGILKEELPQKEEYVIKKLMKECKVSKKDIHVGVIKNTYGIMCKYYICVNKKKLINYYPSFKPLKPYFYDKYPFGEFEHPETANENTNFK